MEIQLYDRMTQTANPIATIKEMGQFLAKSGAFGCSRVEQGELLALICVSENKPPTQIMREWHVMSDGKMMPKARSVHANFLKEGGDIDWILTGREQTDREKMVCKAVFKFTGKKPMELSFSYQDAKAQGLIPKTSGSGWDKNPAAMLKANLIRMGVDFFCPHLVQGDGVEDEVTPGSGPTIQMDRPAATTKVAPAESPLPAKVEPQVIDAQVVIETKTATPETKTAPAATVDSAPKYPELPADLLAKVEAAIGDQGLKALQWLRESGRIKPDAGIANMATALATKIVADPAKFLEVINKPKA